MTKKERLLALFEKYNIPQKTGDRVCITDPLDGELFWGYEKRFTMAGKEIDPIIGVNIPVTIVYSCLKFEWPPGDAFNIYQVPFYDPDNFAVDGYENFSYSLGDMLAGDDWSDLEKLLSGETVRFYDPHELSEDGTIDTTNWQDVTLYKPTQERNTDNGKTE